MTYYCEKCGHKMDENEQVCAFCGAKQMRFSTDYETKKCKKCGKDIYVNANFCPYCGTDQAILDLHKDLQADDWKESDHDNQKNLTKQQRLEQSLLNTDLNDEDSLNQFVKQMNNAGIKVRVIKPEEKNETVHPGLIKSTKLIFKDMFKINKRMGVNDFWWGIAGIMLLTVLIASVIASAVMMMHFKPAKMLRICITIMAPFGLFFQIAMFTATWRRLHDMNMSGALMLLWLFPFFRLLLGFICMMGPRLDNNPYTFKVEDYQKNRNKFN